MLKARFKKQLKSFQLEVDLSMGSNELLVILGASGCGKSTLLNCIAGFIPCDDGYFELEKTVYEDTLSNQHIPINKRHIAYIQQENTLFPHLSVKENILYSVTKKSWPDLKEKYQLLLTLLDINNLENRSPKTLSGGQNQRVAIARALMMEPKLILWDEPFSALDHLIREDLRALVNSLKAQLNIPMIFVTHDLEEAFQLANNLAIMAQGQILQMDKRDKVFNSPVSDTVGKTLGITNVLKATYQQSACVGDSRHGQLISFDCDGLSLKAVDISGRLDGLAKGVQVHIGIRPEQILYVREEAGHESPLAENVEGNIFNAVVLSIVKHLESYRLKIILDGFEMPLMMDIPRGVIQRYAIKEGQGIKVLLKYKRIIIMDVIEGQTANDLNCLNEKRHLLDRLPIEGTLNRYRKMPLPKAICPVIGIAGVSNSGKTRIVTALIGRLASKGYRIGTIKHDGHGFEMDHPGKDTYLHRQAGAVSVSIASRKAYSSIRQTPVEEVSLEALIEDQRDLDLILVEGYKFSTIPKFEVVRKERSTTYVCKEESLLGLITDVDNLAENIPQYKFTELEKIIVVIESIMKEVPDEG